MENAATVLAAAYLIFFVIYICYLPAGRSVLEKYLPKVSEAQIMYFAIETDNTFIIFTFFEKILKV